MEQHKKTKMLAVVSVLTALSVILSYVKLPIIPPPFTFLKLEFADAPMVVSLLLYGPVSALVISVLRNALACVMSGSMGIGELANLMLDVIFILAFALSRRGGCGPVVTLVIAAAATFLGSIVCNLFVFVPLYQLVGQFPSGVATWYYVAAGAGPLNLVKWPVMCALGYWLHKPVRRFA